MADHGIVHVEADGDPRNGWPPGATARLAARCGYLGQSVRPDRKPGSWLDGCEAGDARPASKLRDYPVTVSSQLHSDAIER